MPNVATAYADYSEPEYELINGQELMMAAASLPHLDVQGNLHHIIRNYLKGKHCRVYAEARVVFDDKNWVQPDIAVVCDKSKLKLNHIEGAPNFVAEILSPSTQSRDFNEKKKIYEKFGVPEYWIIDPFAKNVFVYLLEDGKYDRVDIYHLFSPEEWEGLDEKEKAAQKLTLKISLYDDLEIRLAEIFDY
ncbi:MAG: Uma2 family endonuclease [Selenomonadaceae bacterium]|nr:Uma2 family endonuclease [Selenomonadaceae bacterium]